MSRTPSLRLGDLLRTDFRTSAEGDGLNTRLQRELGLDYRYQPARLAIGWSLAEAKPPSGPRELLGKPIRGETLFGADEAELGLWVALITEHAGLEAPTRRDLVELTAAHWLRGARALARRSASWAGPPHAMLTALLAGVHGPGVTKGTVRP